MAYDFTVLKEAIKETEEWLGRELSGVRTGRATPTLLDNVKPEAYGTRSPISQLANVSVEDARTLRVIPWDAALIKDIERGVTEADLGVGVSVDGQGLRITFPELTSERRVQLSKLAGDKTEQARVTLRAHRTDALKALEEAKKEGGMGDDDVTRLKAEVQKLIDAGNEALAALLERKEAEIAQ
ncbi:ribosome recycling factor [Candidatus Kaiserbacteria bacterium CG10_big_fil_rev_8_21_14_0_10_56_12]|uniref:Ribosome recycling factor n=1 Tax=Candidatus Kaiserbacteria bacterium CG10_big_fil_rev_8_21_14_0_10_56_12 TaxID=1974611 RepID=A0A2H0U9R9_9BACT|nr:MAG: ribosome recycling factor [Candidatus Kaiserbacteria bacterium CG10_big_fil_rev_8_21_14_0_10_56_12]